MGDYTFVLFVQPLYLQPAPHASSASLNGDTVLVHATQVFNW